MAARPVTFDPRTTAGFRQKDPGLFTNDAGQYFRPSSGQYGAEQIDYADFYGPSPTAPPATATPPPPPPSPSNPVSGIGYIANPTNPTGPTPQPPPTATTQNVPTPSANPAPVATAGPVATAPGPTAAATAIGGGVTGNMAPVPGFDPGKLADPTHVNDKYTDAAREFAYTLNAIQPQASVAGVQQIAEYLRTVRGLNATATGDKIDFGDGRGPVDVLVDKGGGQFELQFQNGINNGTQNTTAAATAPTAPAGATKTPEGTWIVQQLAPPNGTNGGDWIDNKGQHWTLSNGTPTKAGGAGPTPTPTPGPTTVTPPPTGTGGTTRTVTPPIPPVATAGPVASATGPTSATNPYDSPDVLSAFRMALAKRLGDINSPIDENAANIAAPLQAGRDEAQRVSDQERTALAERLYAQGGLNTNAVTQGIQQSAERNATGLSGLRATLITREYDARRSDLNAMLAQATAAGDAASARAIQEKIAELNATVQREGFGVDLAKYSAYLSQNAVLNGLNG